MNISSYQYKGVSIIEGMVTFAVTAIILAFTLPSAFEQNIRDNVDVSLEFASAAKTALQNSCKANQKALISNNIEAGYFYTPSGSGVDHMNKIELGADCAQQSKVIVIWTSNTGAPTDPVLELTANGTRKESSWTCRVIEGDIRYVPSECQGALKTS